MPENNECYMVKKYWEYVLIVKTMEFVTERIDYSVAELFEKFGCYFPTIVMVNVGFCGEEDGDSFDRGQIIRIHTVSRQQRALARSDGMDQQKDYSIPVNYGEPMSVVDRYGNVGAAQPLYMIMQRNMGLPITVQFPRNHTITVGHNAISTNHIPKMQLVDVFDEVYLLGNCINDGEVSRDVIQVPLYLSDLRLSIVKRIKGKTTQHWLDYVKELNNKCSSVYYDVGFGNPDIAVYKTGAFQAKKEYACVEPITYVNLEELFKNQGADDTEQLGNDDQDADTYEYVNYTSKQKKSHDRYTAVSKETGKFTNTLKSKIKSTFHKKKDDTDLSSESNTFPKKDQPNRLRNEIKSELLILFNSKSNEEKLEITKRPPVAPKPVRPKDSSISTVEKGSNEKVDDPAFMSHLDLRNQGHDKKTNSEPILKKGKTHINLPTMYVQPQDKCQTIEEQEIPVEETDVYENMTLSGTRSTKPLNSPTQIETQSPTNVVLNTALQTSHKGIDVSKLSVSELGHYLKLLKLDKYVNVFTENMVDGSTLVDLTTDILKEEFAFSGFHAIRLMKFAKEGHIPS